MPIIRTLPALLLASSASLIYAQSALAADPASAIGAPVYINDDLSFKPLLDERLRWEDVDQPAKDLGADAVTLRIRAGFEIADKPTHLALLAEAEGNLALDSDYNAYPFKVLTNSQYRPKYSVVADPQNVALNRLQLQYKTKALIATVGRQRINLDDERWVGSVAWRQNEQTFDAARGQLSFAPLTVDVTYSDSQRTIYGSSGSPRDSFGGRFWFIGAAIKTGPITTKGFAYLVDYDATINNVQTVRGQTNSSQTYGGRSTGTFAIAHSASLTLAGSFARQSNYGTNKRQYAADYIAGQADIGLYGFTLKGGYELMGADVTAQGGAWAVQTPMATLHKFDGWADVFLTTPVNGLADKYGGISYKFAKIKLLPGFNAQVTYHQFDSDIHDINYGHEWDGSIGFKTGPVAWLVKYADYIARGGGTTDTKKFWLQAEFGF